jgi:hypothetical protein
VIYDEILARYPGAFADQPRHHPDSGCDHRADFARLHQHIDDAAALQHRHLRHVEEIIMAAIDDLNTNVDTFAQTVDSTVIPALDSLMAAVQAHAGAATEEQLADLATRVQGATDRLRDKAQEAAALVGGEG